MKNFWLCPSLRSLQTCLASALMPVRIVLLLMLAAAATAISAIAQTAHFSGAMLPVYTGNVTNIAADQLGNLYIADQKDKKVLKETPSPTGWVQTVVVSSLASVDAVAVDQTGVVYVVDSADLKVVKEVPLGSIYVTEPVAVNLKVPQAVAVDTNGNVYIAENNNGNGNSDVIQEVPSGNGYDLYIVADGLSSPFGLAADSAGHVFIADTDNNRVLEETPSGGGYSQSTVAVGLNSPSGLTLDGNGNLYIADSENNRIVKATYFFGWTTTTVPTPTLFTPEGNALDPAGNLYIADNYNGVGRVFEMAYTGANFGLQPVGNQTTYLDMLFTFDTGGKLGSTAYKVLTEGVTNGDFADAQEGTCNGLTLYAAGASCWVTVNFTPKAPGMRKGAVALLNGSGQTIASAYVYGIGQGPQIAFTPESFSFIPYTGYGVSFPFGVAVDGNGDVFISDSSNPSDPNNNRILKETWTGSGFTESVIGSGLNSPAGLALDGAGNLYIADTYNDRVLEEMYSNGSYVQSVVASGLNNPFGVAVDVSGNIYIADTNNNRILKIAVVDGIATQTVLPIPGLNTPNAVAVDGSGRVLVVDTGNNRALSVVPHPDGTISETILDSNLGTPYGVAADAMGNAYIADSGNGVVVKEIANSDGSYTYSLLPAIALQQPYAIAVDGKGNVYVADTVDKQVLVESYSPPPMLSFEDATPGFASPDSPKTVTVENIGNEPLVFSSVTFPTDFPEAPNVPLDCTSSTNLAANDSCTVTLDFEPPFSSSPGVRNEAAVLTDNNLNGSNVVQSIAVSGTVMIPPSMTTPAPGTTLSGSSVTFTWNVGAGSTNFQLVAGTTKGGSNVYNGATTTGNSALVTGIPITGGTLYVRLYYYVNNAWSYLDYFYQEAEPPALYSPASGSKLTGSSAMFSWSAGYGNTAYELLIGSTGVGSGNLYASGAITALNATVNGLPTGGGELFVRLEYLVNSAWKYTDYTFVEFGTPVAPVLTSPTPGSTLVASNPTFVWTAGSGITAYELRVGSTGVGSYNLYISGPVQVTSKLVTGLPTGGGELFVQLYYEVDGVWKYTDYTYIEPGTPVAPVLNSPTPGTKLAGSSVTFGWTVGSGITAYELRAGSTGVGSYNLYNSGPVETTSKMVTGLPAAGGELFIRLYYEIDGVWKYTDYTYVEFGTPVAPVLNSPTPGGTLSGSSATFGWTAGSGITAYELRVGSTGAGSYNLYNSGPVEVTSKLVTGLPTVGGELFVRLYYEVDGVWKYTDYTYVEPGTPVAPVLNSPTPGSTLAGSSVLFGWTSGSGITTYELRVGDTGAGSYNLYISGPVEVTSENVSGIPTTGGKIYVRLYYLINAVWKYADYTYTAH